MEAVVLTPSQVHAIAGIVAKAPNPNPIVSIQQVDHDDDGAPLTYLRTGGTIRQVSSHGHVTEMQR